MHSRSLDTPVDTTPRYKPLPQHQGVSESFRMRGIAGAVQAGDLLYLHFGRRELWCKSRLKSGPSSGVFGGLTVGGIGSAI